MYIPLYIHIWYIPFIAFVVALLLLTHMLVIVTALGFQTLKITF